MRQFETGATRDTDEGKLDYEGFISPLVLLRYAEYMHENRVQTDGNLRDSDNWQKGIPQEAYMKSKFRHFMETWMHHRGLGDLAGVDLERALCAELFNTMGYLHVVLEEKRRLGTPHVDHPAEAAIPEHLRVVNRTEAEEANLTPAGDDAAPRPGVQSRGSRMRQELAERDAARETGDWPRRSSGTIGVYSG